MSGVDREEQRQTIGAGMGRSGISSAVCVIITNLSVCHGTGEGERQGRNV